MGCRGLCYGMEDVMVTEGAVSSENLLARAPGGYGLKNAVQLFPQVFMFHMRFNRSVLVSVIVAIMMPER